MVSASPEPWRRAFTQPQPNRLWTFSDLHLDDPRNAWSPVPPADFDVIVAAGDVAQQLPQALAWLHDRFPGVPTVYVPGNHDYWCAEGQVGGLPWTDILKQGRDLAARWGITLLSDDAAVIGGTRFLGATLWTDYRHDQPSLTHALKLAFKGFNDYRRIRRPSTSGKSRKVQPSDLLLRHRASRTFIEDHLAIPHDGPTVVVTHHAPHPTSFLSAHDQRLSHCYVSDLTPVILANPPDLWVHGHIHGRADYRVDGTRIVANARGHVGREPSVAAFDPSLVLEA